MYLTLIRALDPWVTLTQDQGPWYTDPPGSLMSMQESCYLQAFQGPHAHEKHPGHVNGENWGFPTHMVIVNWQKPEKFRLREIRQSRQTCLTNFENVRRGASGPSDKMSSKIIIFAGHFQCKMTDENQKCLTKNPRFVRQNDQRGTKSFREPWKRESVFKLWLSLQPSTVGRVFASYFVKVKPKPKSDSSARLIKYTCTCIAF